MNDPTESIRRQLVAEINADQKSRETLGSLHGRVWNTVELARDFDVTGFAAPFVVVTRKSDGVEGSLEFQHHPRLYYDFRPDT